MTELLTGIALPCNIAVVGASMSGKTTSIASIFHNNAHFRFKDEFSAIPTHDGCFFRIIVVGSAVHRGENVMHYRKFTNILKKLPHSANLAAEQLLLVQAHSLTESLLTNLEKLIQKIPMLVDNLTKSERAGVYVKILFNDEGTRSRKRNAYGEQIAASEPFTEIKSVSREEEEAEAAAGNKPTFDFTAATAAESPTDCDISKFPQLLIFDDCDRPVGRNSIETMKLKKFLTVWTHHWNLTQVHVMQSVSSGLIQILQQNTHYLLYQCRNNFNVAAVRPYFVDSLRSMMHNKHATWNLSNRLFRTLSLARKYNIPFVFWELNGCNVNKLGTSIAFLKGFFSNQLEKTLTLGCSGVSNSDQASADKEACVFYTLYPLGMFER